MPAKPCRRPRTVAEGAPFFRKLCVACHGRNWRKATGAAAKRHAAAHRGPDLAGARQRRAGSRDQDAGLILGDPDDDFAGIT